MKVIETLDDYIVTRAPPKVYYVSDFVSKQEEFYLWRSVYGAPNTKWTVLRNRRLQNWGGTPSPEGMLVEPLPRWMDELSAQLTRLGCFGGRSPNHVLVNEYLPNQGIMAHEDGPAFHPCVCTVST